LTNISGQRKQYHQFSLRLMNINSHVRVCSPTAAIICQLHELEVKMQINSRGKGKTKKMNVKNVMNKSMKELFPKKSHIFFPMPSIAGR